MKGLSYLISYLYVMHQVVLAHTYLFWVKCHSKRAFIPKKLEWEPQNIPFFLPITKPHPLNTLTRGPPLMYWLGTSRWCLGPLCMLHSVWICFFLAFTPFLLPLHCLILLLILIDVYPLWCEGCVGFWAHISFLSSLPRLGITQAKAFIFLLNPCFLLYGRGPFWPLILPCHFIVSVIILSFFLFLITSWVCGLMFLPCQPISSSILCSGLSWFIFHVFTSFGLVGQHSSHVSLFYHFIP